MRIAVRSSSIVLLLLSACGSGARAPVPTGATIDGTVLNSSQALSVDVPGATASTSTNASGSFLLAAVPEGATSLRFSGSGSTATLPISRVVNGEYRRMRVVAVAGSQFQEQCERTETEFEGRVTKISGTILTVADRTVTVNDTTIVKDEGSTVGIDAIKVGAPVEVEGALQADGTVLARRISIEKDEQGAGVVLVGTLTGIAGNKLTVGGQTVTLSGGTEIFRGDAKIDASALKVGDRLLVRGDVGADGSIAARRIRVLEDEEQDFHVTGAVTAISLEQKTFTVGQTVIAVDAQTRFQGRVGAPTSLAELRVGDKVDAEVVKQRDGSLLAKVVEAFRPPPPPSPAVTAQGPIEAPLGPATITVAGRQFSVTDATVITRAGAAVPFSALQVGQSAVVKGAPASDGSLVAQAIEVVLTANALPKLVSVKGPIDEVGSSSISVVGQLFQVGTYTLIMRGNAVVPLSNLQPQQSAQVTGKVGDGNVLLAQAIHVAN